MDSGLSKNNSNKTFSPDCKCVICPDCGSPRIWKDGFRKSANKKIQRYLCRVCGYRFSKSSVKSNVITKVSKLSHSDSNLAKQVVGDGKFSIKKGLDESSLHGRKDVGSQNSNPQDITTSVKDLNSFLHYNSDCQICVTQTKGTKNLVKVENNLKTAQREGTSDYKSKIFAFAWYMKKQGYADSTIESYTAILKSITKKGVDLENPENVKEVVAKQENWSKGRQWNVCKAYTLFLKMQGKTWKKPRYKPIPKIPFIPTEKEIDQLIAATSKQMSTFLQVLKETGARRGEAFNLNWSSIDLVAKTIRIEPEKGSNPRIFKISDKLISMLHRLPKNHEKIWIYKNCFNLSRSFRKQRKRLSSKLGNPRLLKIHFHTIRHWKATTEYAKTKDILYVQNLLGHKSLKSTLHYTQFVAIPQNQEYVCKTATTIDEAKELIEAGFTYITTMENTQIFRKLKASYLGP